MKELFTNKDSLAYRRASKPAFRESHESAAAEHKLYLVQGLASAVREIFVISVQGKRRD
jgi:hypothetical protein